MWDSLKTFYRRHRGKIVFGGVVVGVCGVGKFVKYKYDEWQREQVEQEQQEARKRFHYESHQRTCTATFVSFLPNIRNQVGFCGL